MKKINEMSLDGGILCLDFINTVTSRTSETYQDYFYDFRQILEWCQRLTLLDQTDFETLLQFVDQLPDKGERALKKFIIVRENLWKIFSAIVLNKAPLTKDVDLFNKHLSDALSKLQFQFAESSHNLFLNHEKANLYSPLDDILKSAFDLLTQEHRDRIKMCGECGWMFFDISKNNTRQWCNPNACGTVNRSRRYQKRKKDLSNKVELGIKEA